MDSCTRTSSVTAASERGLPGREGQFCHEEVCTSIALVDVAHGLHGWCAIQSLVSLNISMTCKVSRRGPVLQRVGLKAAAIACALPPSPLSYPADGSHMVYCNSMAAHNQQQVVPASLGRL
eukprot:351776-Chlamydomonas_euryale.AAC.8